MTKQLPTPQGLQKERVSKSVVSHLFDAGREVCDDFQHVVGFGKVLTDESLLGTDDPDGQAGTWRKKRG